MSGHQFKLNASVLRPSIQGTSRLDLVLHTSILAEFKLNASVLRTSIQGALHLDSVLRTSIPKALIQLKRNALVLRTSIQGACALTRYCTPRSQALHTWAPVREAKACNSALRTSIVLIFFRWRLENSVSISTHQVWLKSVQWLPRNP